MGFTLPRDSRMPTKKKSVASDLNYRRIYEFYKIDFDQENSKDIIGACPFCGADEHFSVHKTEGIFRCFKCEATGNIFSFFTMLCEKFFERTTEEEYRTLAKARGLMWSVIKSAGWAFDPDYDRWLVPFKDETKFLNNLGVCYPFSSKLGYRILKAPEIPLKLYRPFNTRKLEGDVWAFEGEWDLLAAKCAFKKEKVTSPPCLISSCGSTTWTDPMNKAVKGQDVVFFWDNDDGGQNKGKAAIKKLVSNCTYSFVSWEGFPEDRKSVV